MFSFKGLDLFVSDLNLSFIIHLVCKAHDLDVTSRVFFYLTEPHRYTQERLSISQIKDYNDAISSLVVSVCDSAVSLLSSSVPYLQLDSGLVDLKSAESEVNTNCADVVFLETVVLKSLNKHIRSS